MGISREGWGLRDGTPPNKKKTFRARRKPFGQEENLSGKKKTFRARRNTNKQEETPPNKKKTFRARKNTFRARKNTSKQEEAPTNKKKPFEQGKRLSINKKNTFQARKCLSSKGYLPIKCKSLQVAGVPRQGKAVVSDGGYGVIGGGYCLLVWGDAGETKGKRGRRCHGMAGYGCLPPFFLEW